MMRTKNQPEWTKLIRGEALQVEGSSVIVRLGNGRGHRVTVSAAAGHYVLQSLVAGASVLDALDGPSAVWAWRQNSGARLYHLHIDDRGRLIGEANVPKPCLTPDEFMLYLVTLARACDTLEYMLTGRDREQQT
jgi:hypothetical protein